MNFTFSFLVSLSLSKRTTQSKSIRAIRSFANSNFSTQKVTLFETDRARISVKKWKKEKGRAQEEMQPKKSSHDERKKKELLEMVEKDLEQFELYSFHWQCQLLQKEKNPDFCGFFLFSSEGN